MTQKQYNRRQTKPSRYHLAGHIKTLSDEVTDGHEEISTHHQLCHQLDAAAADDDDDDDRNNQ